MYKYKCRDCGALLYDDDITDYVTDYGQKHMGCPCCAGGEVAPCEQCIDCEQWVDCEETSEEGRCYDCDMIFEEKESFKEFGGYYDGNGEFIKVATYEEFHEALSS